MCYSMFTQLKVLYLMLKNYILLIEYKYINKYCKLLICLRLYFNKMV